MKQILFGIIVFVCAAIAQAQVVDDFSDGNFTANPAWMPDLAANWTIISGQLRSNATTANSSFQIVTPSATSTNARWEFWLQLNFNTSSANYVDVFLMSDQSNLSAASTNGYFVRIGGTADDVSLYKVTNGTAAILINGLDGITNSSANTLRIRVTRDINNVWLLERDVTGTGTDYVSEGTQSDASFLISSFFGIRIQQSTSSFFQRHFFDDIYVGAIPPPPPPPVPITKKEIIITEIMADPSPTIGLPDAEYVELFNRTNRTVSLSGLRLTDGSSTAVFPAASMSPGSYLLLTSTSNASKFAGSVLGMANFPTLNNDGDAIMLRRSDNRLIDSVAYTLDWYRSEDKSEGGWALELIDLQNPCGEQDNWAAAEASAGGTPGTLNSINANKPDVTGPKLEAAVPNGLQQVELLFNEKLNTDLGAIAVTLTPDVGITSLALQKPALTRLIVSLASPLQPRQLYQVAMSNLRDCAGNLIQQDFAQSTFALPEEADSLDLVINEVLFNPRVGGYDYVEIFNRSEKFINLFNWRIASRENGVLQNAVAITVSRLIAPGGYLVLTERASEVMFQYPRHEGRAFMQSKLPSLPDDEGVVTLVGADGQLVDEFRYARDFHSELIKDEEGVALERISAEAETQQASNWTSASSVVGFGTPGLINSQSRPDPLISPDEVIVEPEVIAPGSGRDEFALVRYQFDQPGRLANAKVVDHQGRVIRTLANNELLGTEGFLRWDGDHDNGSKVRPGYYAVWFEVYGLEGNVKTYRKRVVVGPR
ncbi:MAG: lamin tail domain-containing protein [Cyclobacteriaceae bacterium]|jgi:hypothetical protein|nr:lamin tail domain-containing protein [Flammeovirgaceae bacterium]